MAQAQITMGIIEQGHYQYEDQPIVVKPAIANAVEQAFTIAPEAWEGIMAKALRSQWPQYDMRVEVKNCTTLAAALAARGEGKIGILNFASAKNPGGGFLKGAMAQEESLASTSCLYATLEKDITMYDYNRAHATYLYSDYMIYSPDVVFWMDEQGNLLQHPLLADVITAPAPNRGAMLQNQRLDELPQVAPVLKARIEKVLTLAQMQGIEILVLGAWGCGVFRNEPKLVASLFKAVIRERFDRAFQKIIYAVFDTSATQANFNAFLS